MLLVTPGSRPRFDPVHDSQRTFRAVLGALASPGTIVPLPVRDEEAPIEGWATAILRTLCDHETRVAVELEAGSAELLRHLQQRVGVVRVPVDQAEFFLSAASSCAPEWITRLPRGSLAYPDRGATAILLVDALGLGPLHLSLRGPGCCPGATLRVQGLPWALLAARAAAVASYPCGIDLLVVDAAGQLAAIPRSTFVERVLEGAH
ncbi:MAG: phosphonate C-P lyase system protein PhnH [Chloroflexota bacterium]|nr:phosphonate C-P lyase system protein PhnH [Dehalococcoidia bacterium]MDW8255229.1 phosphonate C-P lyase system protein PhnH [Chloroflexota bacterium]